MASLIGIRIENFRALADITLGSIRHGKDQPPPLPGLMALIGPNGSGKSSILDAFGFIADCLRDGVEQACDRDHRGGFARLRTRGASGPIRFVLYWRADAKEPPITYTLAIDADGDRPYVAEESLLQRRRTKSGQVGRPMAFLKLTRGQGLVWSGEQSLDGDDTSRIEVKLDDPARLGIATLGQLRDHPRIVAIRAWMDGWYLSYFMPNAARTLTPAGAQRRLDTTGSNLGNYLQHLERTLSPEQLNLVLKRTAARIPGIQGIRTQRSEDGRLLVQFNERGFQDPFFQSSMSDGTLKLFAYHLLLADPLPPPLMGIEEPENGLYHQLLFSLATEFREHAASGTGRQILVTTHSPYFIDALSPNEVWLMRRGPDGHAHAIRTADIPTIKALVADGVPLGSLWFSRHFQEFEEVAP